MHLGEFLAQSRWAFVDRSDCPNTDLITQFALGKLTHDARLDIEAHILNCNSCLESLKRVYSTRSDESAVNELLRILLKNPPNDTK